MIEQGDSRVHYGFDKSVLEHRAKHDRLVDDLIRHGSRTVAVRVVVEGCQQFVDMLRDEGVLEAYAAVEKAIRLIASQSGAKAMDLSEAKGASCQDPNTRAMMIIRYIRWYEACEGKYYAPSMIRKMIVDGVSLNQLDAASKFRHGTSKKNVINCLNLWQHA